MTKQGLIDWVNSLPEDTPEETLQQLAAMIGKVRSDYEREKYLRQAPLETRPVTGGKGATQDHRKTRGLG